MRCGRRAPPVRHDRSRPRRRSDGIDRYVMGLIVGDASEASGVDLRTNVRDHIPGKVFFPEGSAGLHAGWVAHQGQRASALRRRVDPLLDLGPGFRLPCPVLPSAPDRPVRGTHLVPDRPRRECMMGRDHGPGEGSGVPSGRPRRLCRPSTPMDSHPRDDGCAPRTHRPDPRAQGVAAHVRSCTTHRIRHTRFIYLVAHSNFVRLGFTRTSIPLMM